MELLIGCFLCHVYADVRDTRGGSDPGLLSELGVTLLFYNCFRDTLQRWRHIGRIGGAALRVARVGLRPPSPRRSAGRRVYLYARPLRRHAFLSDHDNLCRVSVSRSAASFCISSLIFSMSCLVSARGPIVPGSRSNGSDSDIGGDGASVGGSIADVICSRLDIGRTSTATGTARDSREHIQVPIRSVLFCDKHGFRQSE